jgi:hypothetical protein
MPINQNGFIILTQEADAMVGVFFAGVLDGKIIND